MNQLTQLLDRLTTWLGLTRRELLQLTALWAGWRILVCALSRLSDAFIEYSPTYPQFQQLLEQPIPSFLAKQAGFDGVHYLTIAQFGYTDIVSGITQAFFPIYPLLIRALSSISLNSILAGLLLSSLAFLAALITFYKLIKLHFSAQIAWHSSIALVLFPTSFFFGMLYTEALFLLLVTQSFWQAEKGRWWWAGAFAAVASATRVVGILLVPALLILLLRKHYREPAGLSMGLQLLPGRLKQLAKLSKLYFLYQTLRRILRERQRELAAIATGALGLFVYMSYLQQTFGDPLYFFSVQEEFGGGRSESLVLYPQVIWRYLKISFTADLTWQAWISYAQEFAAGTLGLLGIVWSWRKVPPSWLFFALGAFFIPTLTGTFSSLSRYILVALPLFVAIGLETDRSRWVRWGWWSVSGVLLVVNTVLFIQGVWVA